MAPLRNADVLWLIALTSPSVSPDRKDLEGPPLTVIFVVYDI
jgi:hypothetical protein